MSREKFRIVIPNGKGRSFTDEFAKHLKDRTSILNVSSTGRTIEYTVLAFNCSYFFEAYPEAKVMKYTDPWEGIEISMRVENKQTDKRINMKETLEEKRDRIYNEYEASLAKVQSVRYEASKELQQKRDRQLAELDNEAKGLYLLTVDGCLFVKYMADTIGWIDQAGVCQFMSNVHRLQSYEAWIASGAKVNTSSEVQWRGRRYYLTKGGILRSEYRYEDASFVQMSSTPIFDFLECAAFKGCTDDNIKRHKHNLKPVIF